MGSALQKVTLWHMRSVLALMGDANPGKYKTCKDGLGAY